MKGRKLDVPGWTEIRSLGFRLLVRSELPMTRSQRCVSELSWRLCAHPGVFRAAGSEVTNRSLRDVAIPVR